MNKTWLTRVTAVPIHHEKRTEQSRAAAVVRRPPFHARKTQTHPGGPKQRQGSTLQQNVAFVFTLQTCVDGLTSQVCSFFLITRVQHYLASFLSTERAATALQLQSHRKRATGSSALPQHSLTLPWYPSCRPRHLTPQAWAQSSTNTNPYRSQISTTLSMSHTCWHNKKHEKVRRQRQRTRERVRCSASAVFTGAFGRKTRDVLTMSVSAYSPTPRRKYYVVGSPHNVKYFFNLTIPHRKRYDSIKIQDIPRRTIL